MIKHSISIYFAHAVQKVSFTSIYLDGHWHSQPVPVYQLGSCQTVNTARGGDLREGGGPKPVLPLPVSRDTAVSVSLLTDAILFHSTLLTALLRQGVRETSCGMEAP